MQFLAFYLISGELASIWNKFLTFPGFQSKKIWNVRLKSVFVSVANAMRFDVDLTEFPLIKRISETLLDEECFKVSHPDIQPDNPNTK